MSNTISNKLDKISDDFVYSWINYGFIAATFVIFILLELVKVQFDIKILLQPQLWMSILLQLLLQIMVLYPMVVEGERAGLKTTAYRDNKNVLSELLSRIRTFGHSNKFDNYLRKYNKMRQKEWLEKALATVGLSQYEKSKTLTLAELSAKPDLNKEQKHFLKKLTKATCPIKPVATSKFYSTLSLKSEENALIINKKAERYKIIIPRLMMSMAFMALVSLMILDIRDQIPLIVIVTIGLKLFTILTNVVFGFLGGRYITAELSPFIFNNRIEVIKAFAIENHYFTEYDIEITKSDEGKEDALSGNDGRIIEPTESATGTSE